MLFPNSYSSFESVAPLRFDAGKDNTAHVRNVHCSFDFGRVAFGQGIVAGESSTK
jgi:hypothetical protein